MIAVLLVSTELNYGLISLQVFNFWFIHFVPYLAPLSKGSHDSPVFPLSFLSIIPILTE